MRTHKEMVDFHQFDVVHIKKLNRVIGLAECIPGTETPKVEDIATILEIFEIPTLGYELECVNPETGETKYLVTVNANDIVLGLLARGS